MYSYRNFIREQKRALNKISPDSSYDKVFEAKVDLYLNETIGIKEFERYLDKELYLSTPLNEGIISSVAKKFYKSVTNKVKSFIDNINDKIKSSKGFELVIKFFDKVSTGFNKFYKFLKKVKAGKLLKKMLITLGISSIVTYIFAQFGAGWVALMGGRMAASTVGSKIGNSSYEVLDTENVNELINKLEIGEYMYGGQYSFDDPVKELDVIISHMSDSNIIREKYFPLIELRNGIAEGNIDELNLDSEKIGNFISKFRENTEHNFKKSDLESLEKHFQIEMDKGRYISEDFYNIVNDFSFKERKGLMRYFSDSIKNMQDGDFDFKSTTSGYFLSNTEETAYSKFGIALKSKLTELGVPKRMIKDLDFKGLISDNIKIAELKNGGFQGVFDVNDIGYSDYEEYLKGKVSDRKLNKIVSILQKK